MTDQPITAGQVYQSADPRGGARIRISSYRPGDARAYVLDAATGERYRQILVSFLHVSPVTQAGRPRRTGCVLVRDAEELQP